MKKIVKNFVEIYTSADMEGRYYDWFPSKLTHDEAVANMANSWAHAVRTVEKTFDPETFTITNRVLRATEKPFYKWEGKIRELDPENLPIYYY